MVETWSKTAKDKRKHEAANDEAKSKRRKSLQKSPLPVSGRPSLPDHRPSASHSPPPAGWAGHTRPKGRLRGTSARIYRRRLSSPDQADSTTWYPPDGRLRMPLQDRPSFNRLRRQSNTSDPPNHNIFTAAQTRVSPPSSLLSRTHITNPSFQAPLKPFSDDSSDTDIWLPDADQDGEAEVRYRGRHAGKARARKPPMAGKIKRKPLAQSSFTHSNSASSSPHHTASSQWSTAPIHQQSSPSHQSPDDLFDPTSTPGSPPPPPLPVRPVNQASRDPFNKPLPSPPLQQQRHSTSSYHIPLYDPPPPHTLPQSSLYHNSPRTSPQHQTTPPHLVGSSWPDTPHEASAREFHRIGNNLRRIMHTLGDQGERLLRVEMEVENLRRKIGANVVRKGMRGVFGRFAGAGAGAGARDEERRKGGEKRYRKTGRGRSAGAQRKKRVRNRLGKVGMA
ncbi:MAG: hypothetical protein Q9227_006921 [Pyrenula ochraceoflavens]